MMDNEQDGIRGLLHRSTPPSTPKGLEDRVLLRIAEEMDRRSKKRLALYSVLRIVALGLLLVAVVQSFLPGGMGKTIAKAAGQLTDNPGGKIAWLLENTYFLFPLLGLYIFSKIYRAKVR